jgi:hypothetical protein
LVLVSLGLQRVEIQDPPLDRSPRSQWVAAVGRRAADLPARAGLTPLALDITAPEAEEVLRAAVDVAGGLDVLVNNAGYGLFGSVEQTPAAEERAVIDKTCWPTWPCCGPPCPPCAPRTAGSCRSAR